MTNLFYLLMFGPTVAAVGKQYFSEKLKPFKYAEQSRPYTKKFSPNDVYFSYLYKPEREKRWAAIVDPAEATNPFNEYIWNDLTPMERINMVRSGKVDRYYVFSPNQALEEQKHLVRSNPILNKKIKETFGSKYYQELTKPSYKTKISKS